jgi:hypothetical protein
MKSLVFFYLHLFTVLSVVPLTLAAPGCTGLTQPIFTTLPSTALLTQTVRATDTSTAPSQATEVPAAPSQLVDLAVTFRTVVQGFRLGATLSSPALLLAVDDQSLEAVASLIDEDDRPLLRSVDLEEQALLAAFWGVKPTGGCSITIQVIYLDGNELVVEALLQENDPAFPRIEAATSPYHLVIADKDIFKGSSLRYRLVSGGAILASGILP